MEKLDPKSIENILALTPLQEGMLFHYLQDPQSGLYFEQLCLEISGEIDAPHFEKAWNVVSETNEMLRTVFRWEKLEKPSQIILKEHKCNVIFYDLSAKECSQKKTTLAEIKEKDRRESFDLHQVPFRVILCKLDEKKYEVVISNHHILYDGWSNGVILKEFFKAYHELRRGGRSLKLPVKPPFKEFIGWIHSRDRNKQEQFWREYLAGVETPTELPIKRRVEETTKAVDYSIILEEDIKGKLAVFVKNSRVTLAPVFYTAWGILLQKYCGSEDVVFGTTVSGRSGGLKGIEDMVGLFINTIPLRAQTPPGERIGDVVFRTDRLLREREEFENAPLVDIGSYSSVVVGGSLFDTIVAIENYPLDNRLVPEGEGSLLSIQSYSIVEMTHYDLSVGIMLFNEIEIKFSCKQELFENGIIENLARHFKGIIQNIVENPETALSQLEIISGEEKNRILYDFNDTDAEYPKDKTIHQLFVEQVEKTPGRIALVGAALSVGPVSLSYRQLNEQSGRLAGLLIEKGVLADNIVGIKVDRSIEMVIGIFGILKAGGAYLPIDPHYPQERIDYMLKDSAAKILLTAAECIFNFHHSSFIIHHSNRSTHLAYIIYTSGSTGKPKGVLIEHASVVNRMFWVKERYQLNERDVVLQAASFVFDVSVCELFRWVPAGARLYLLPPGGEMDPGLIVKTIGRYRITTADFVPSILTLILDQVDKHKSYDELASLKWMFTGVETVSLNLLKRFRETLERFNNTTLINAYGPTESTVDVTYFQCTGNYDTVPIGKPMANVRVYIVDKFGNLQPPGIGGELCIAGKGLARGYLNNPELTCEKFNRSYRSYKTYILYRTGDLARWLSDGNIEFLGRMDHQVKIRGFRVEPGEIVGRLLNYPGIKEAVVLVWEEERGDKYLCAYVVSDVENAISELREFLAKELPEYMIPAYFMPLEKIPLTSSGKVDRKALPKPRFSAGEKYTAPRNELERKLVEIWSDVLGRDALHSSQLQASIGIDDHFFRLGGHSLKATILAAKIHKVFDVKVPLPEIFKSPTIRGLSGYIGNAVGEQYVHTAPVEKKEYYVLSSAQRRLYFLQQMELESTGYNMTSIMTLEGRLDREKFVETFNKLIARHESLRTSFVLVGEEPVQRIKSFAELFQKRLPEEWRPPEAFIKSFIRPFDLSSAPLMRVGLLEIAAEESLLIVDMHHIISDGTSMGILVKEFMALYEGKELPPLKIHYKDYAEWQTSEMDRESLSTQEKYWPGQFAEEIPILNLPTDYTRPLVQGFEGNYVPFDLTVEETSSLKTMALQKEVTLYMLLLAVCNTWFSKLCGEEDIVIGTPIAGRRHDEHQDIVGMFVNTLALRNYPASQRVFDDFLKEIKERTLEAFQNQDYPFEVLVDKVVKNRDTSRNPLFDVMFVFQNMDIPGIEIPGLILKPYKFENKTSKFDLNLDGMEKDDRLFFSLEYSTKLFKDETARRFSAYFKNIINSVIENPGVRIADIEILGKEEKEKILEISNGIEEYVDPNETVHGMFEKVVSGNEDKTALVFGTGRITYGELNRGANRLARVLRSRGVGRDHTVGLMVERSFDTVTGMLAVMKAGGAYLPMDPKLPGQRKRFMMEDSRMTALLTNFEIHRAAAYIPGNIPILDMRDNSIYRDIPADEEEPANMNNGSDLVYVIFTSGSTGMPKGVMLEHINLVNLIKFHHRYTGIDCTKVLQFATISFDASFHEIFSALLAGGELYLIDEETRNNIPALFELIAKNKVKTLFLPMAFLKLIFSHDDYIDIFPGSVTHIQTAGEQVMVDDRLGNYLKGAKIYLHNHYGPSETHVVTVLTLDPREDIPEFPAIGKPVMNTCIYILDKEKHLLPMGVAGELYAGGLQVGRGYLNNPELTAEKFNRSYKSYKTYILYRTGDLARWLSNGDVEFLGRLDQQVKIRGIRVEPGEIESHLKKIEFIKDAIVVVKQGANGEKHLCAYVVLDIGIDLDVSQLRNILADSLPNYMIPTYFAPMDKIPLTPSGKLDRRALPEPNIKKEKTYAAPRNHIEEELVGIWSEILGSDALHASQLQTSIGIDDNFFQLGGHSLKAIGMVNKIQKNFGVKIAIQTLFRFPTIAEVAAIIKSSNISDLEEIEKQPEQPHYEMSYSQKRLWYINRSNPRNTAYNMPAKSTFYEIVDEQVTRKVLEQLMSRHESLRTSFKEVKEGPVQVIEPQDTVVSKLNFAVLDLSQLDKAERENQRIRLLMEESSHIFNLEKGPLFRARLVKCTEEEYDFIFNIHHIISDGWSLEVLKKEFFQVYESYKKGVKCDLVPLKIQYKDYAAWQNRLLNDEEKMGKAKEFWKNYLNDSIPTLNLPYDFSAKPLSTKKSSAYCFLIEEDLVERLHLLAGEQKVSLFIVLLAAFNILLSHITCRDNILIGIPAAARQHWSLQNIIGLFVNTLILQTKVKAKETFNDFLGRFQADTFNVLEYQGYPLEIIFGELKIKYPEISAFFNMLNIGSRSQERIKNFKSYHIEETQETKFPIHCYLTQYQNGIQMECHYFRELFMPETIEKIMQIYTRILENISGSPLKKIKELAKKVEKN